jgi:hypothetical protein
MINDYQAIANDFSLPYSNEQVEVKSTGYKQV